MQSNPVTDAFAQLYDGIITALPDVLTGLVFLWFAVGLSVLSIVGLTQIAASLGTATGFLALGVPYALSGIIADAVAGVYRLRDPVLIRGTESAPATRPAKSVQSSSATRFLVDGDVVVRANAEIEKNWTKLSAE